MLYLLQIFGVLLNLFVFLLSALIAATVVYVLLRWLLDKSESAVRHQPPSMPYSAAALGFATAFEPSSCGS
jgi:uncharacterized membrane protein YdjX (TVP38/TMEM64 family)